MVMNGFTTLIRALFVPRAEPSWKHMRSMRTLMHTLPTTATLSESLPLPACLSSCLPYALHTAYLLPAVTTPVLQSVSRHSHTTTPLNVSNIIIIHIIIIIIHLSNILTLIPISITDRPTDQQTRRASASPTGTPTRRTPPPRTRSCWRSYVLCRPCPLSARPTAPSSSSAP